MQKASGLGRGFDHEEVYSKKCSSIQETTERMDVSLIVLKLSTPDHNAAVVLAWLTIWKLSFSPVLHCCFPNVGF